VSNNDSFKIKNILY